MLGNMMDCTRKETEKSLHVVFPTVSRAAARLRIYRTLQSVMVS